MTSPGDEPTAHGVLNLIPRITSLTVLVWDKDCDDGDLDDGAIDERFAVVWSALSSGKRVKIRCIDLNLCRGIAEHLTMRVMMG